ncbi:MAG: PAS domain-containing protein [Leptolyngbya sp.]|nr:PAS domain-containing protein [Leptolyngbya sp.]
MVPVSASEMDDPRCTNPQTPVREQTAQAKDGGVAPRDLPGGGGSEVAQGLLTGILDRIKDGVVAIDAQNRIVYLNPRAATMLQVSLAEWQGKKVWGIFPEALSHPVYADARRAIAEQRSICETYFYPPSQRWFEHRIYPSHEGLTVYLTDVTEHQQAAQDRLKAEKLRVELTLLETILESILAGYWDIDFARGTNYMSPGLKRMLGYDDADLPTEVDTWQRLIFAEDLPPTLACLGRHIDSHGAEPYYNEVRYHHKDGSTVWVLCSGRVIEWDEAGKPLYMVGCHVDITRLKEAEGKLQHSEAHLRESQRIGNLGSWTVETATNRMTWSDQLYRIFGLPPDTVLANFEALQQYFHPDDRERHRQVVEQTLATQDPYDDEFRIVRPDGCVATINVRGETLGNAQGVATHLMGTVQDITQRKQAEQQLADLSLQLNLALDSGRIGTWSIDLQTEAVTWDDRLLHIYGLDHAPSSLGAWLETFHREDLPLLETDLAQVLTGAQPTPQTLRFLRRDGELRWVRATALMETDADGQPWRMIGTLVDVTETKLAEEKLHQTSAQLIASNQELEAFAYSVSHDLRAPLRAIDGFSQALLEDYGDRVDEEGQDYFRRIRNNVQRMGQLIDDLLRLSRVSRMAMHYEWVDLTALVAEQVAELQRDEPDRGMEVHLTPNLGAWVDRTLVQVVITNLVQNAWKFTSHHPQAHITFGQIQQDGEPVYFLQDDGAGFDMAYANQLFGVFQRLHNTEEFPGTGIGLATVQRVIHRHGGRVWAEAAVEQGATFYFTLPLRPALAGARL